MLDNGNAKAIYEEIVEEIKEDLVQEKTLRRKPVIIVREKEKIDLVKNLLRRVGIEPDLKTARKVS